MWNIKYVLLSILMIIIDIYGIRGIILTGDVYYYAGLLICLIITVAMIRQIKN